MMTATFEDYIHAIRNQYEVAKLETYSSFLINPSPAQLRNLCLLQFENKLSKSDESVFMLFFETSDALTLRKRITTFDVEKFRAVGNFLRGKSEKTNAVSLNLIAILIGFEPRPFAKFIQNERETPLPSKMEEEKTVIISKPMERIKEVSNSTISMKKIINFVAFGVVLFLVCYVVKDVLFPEKMCMQWQIDHYDLVDCSISGITSVNKIEPIDPSKKILRKVQVTKKTPFFRDGKAIVYYCKCDSKLDYFNASGFHPENGKALKPITNYIIDKYVKE